ncbi:response regulator transcription factor [Actinoplanes sp. LDG1-06]|uniref:Response regulator transcription factor n=1 Tax=Paractinoplanes ovalisporus TaxID=2810368 RepID=A0ABS2AIB0_9ACTN|nr:response regulator transcription factor [Actinoplanes ovalisporus]MBM2619589.1 response regulator transcription factor [Actinoplanes ovalisporus]
MRVVIAEDNPLLRDGIVLLLREHDIEVAAAVDNAETLLAAVAEHRPDAAVVDVRMPPDHTDEGLRAALTIRAEHPSVSVLVFSQWIETSYARRLLSEHSGHVGYLLKDRIVSTGEFVEALRRVAAGGTALDPEVVRHLLAAPSADAGLARLSAREREILGLLAEGRSNIAIAELLHLADRSVEKHVTAIFTKLDLPQDRSDHRRVLAVLRYLRA